jgi:CRISPR system Cascade subunit CasE
VKRAGRRHGLVRDEELTDWITRQITNHGAELLGVVPSETQHEILGRRRSGPRIRLTGTTFDGAFRAGEAEGINRLLRDGIGHARAFGFGLVTIGR